MVLVAGKFARQRQTRRVGVRILADMEPQPHLPQAPVILGADGERDLGVGRDRRVGVRHVDRHVRDEVGGRFDFIPRRIDVLDSLGILQPKDVGVGTRLGEYEVPAKDLSIGQNGRRPRVLPFNRDVHGFERLVGTGLKGDLRSHHSANPSFSGRKGHRRIGPCIWAA